MKRTGLFIGLLLLSCTVKAQKYHDAQAFGLSGHVKECVIIEGEDDVFGFNQIEFDQDGRLIFYDYNKVTNRDCDHEGYLKSYSVNINIGMDLRYDTKHNVIKSTDRYENSVTYFYDNKGKPLRFNIFYYILQKDADFTLETSAYDKHNNFLEYKCINDEGNVNKYKRKIIYWDDSSSKDNYNLWNLSDIAFFNTVKVQKVMPVVISNPYAKETIKTRIVFTAPKGTTSKEVTDLYLVGFKEKDRFESHIPRKIHGLVYHDLGPKEYLGIDVLYGHYKFESSELSFIQDYECIIEGESEAQYLLDLNTNDTEWKRNSMLQFRETKDVNPRKHKNYNYK